LITEITEFDYPLRKFILKIWLSNYRFYVAYGRKMLRENVFAFSFPVVGCSIFFSHNLKRLGSQWSRAFSLSIFSVAYLPIILCKIGWGNFGDCDLMSPGFVGTIESAHGVIVIPCPNTQTWGTRFVVILAKSNRRSFPPPEKRLRSG
jgi:hypothetical protein